MLIDTPPVVVLRDGKQLFETANQKLNRLCWSPEGFGYQDVMVIEGDLESLALTMHLMRGGIKDGGGFKRKTKHILHVGVGKDSFKAVTTSRGSFAYSECKYDLPFSMAMKKVINEVIPGLHDYGPVDILEISTNTLTQSAIQLLRASINESGLAMHVVIYAEQVDDIIKEIADVYAHVQYVDMSITIDRLFEEPTVLTLPV